MSLIKIRGIIINENRSGESDKFITIFAKKVGKISVYAKGASNIKSKFLAGTSLFTYGDFLIRTTTKTPTLNSVDIIENFYSITKDIDKYYCGVYLLEFCLKAIEDVPDDDKYLYLLLKTLKYLSNDNSSSLLALRLFELKMLKFLGYNPYNSNCTFCGTVNPTNFSLDGLICDKCSTMSTKNKLSHTTIYALKYISNSEINDLFKFSIDNNTLKELSFISEQYIYNYIDCHLKSYDYIKKCIDK